MFVYEPRGFPFPFLKWKNQVPREILSLHLYIQLLLVQTQTD